MLKRIILLTMFFVMLVNIMAVGYAQEIKAVDGMNIELGPLEKLIEYALQNSADLESFDRQIAEMEITLKDVQKAYDSMKNISIRISSASAGEVLQKYGYNLKQVQYAYDSLFERKEQAKKSLEFGIRQAYTGLIQMQNQKKYQEKTRDMLSKQVQITEIRHKLKMATDLDVISVKDQLSRLDNQLIQLETNQKNLMRDLKKLANVPEDYIIELVDNFELGEEKNYDVNEMVAKALDQRLDVKDLKNSIELQQLKVDIYGRVFSRASSVYKKEPIVLEDLQKQMDDKLQNVRNDITDKITNLKLSRDAYILAEEAYKRAQERNRITEIKYNLGMISSIEMLNSELTLMDAYNKSREALFKYINEKVDLELACTYGAMTVY